MSFTHFRHDSFDWDDSSPAVPATAAPAVASTKPAAASSTPSAVVDKPVSKTAAASTVSSVSDLPVEIVEKLIVTRRKSLPQRLKLPNLNYQGQKLKTWRSAKRALLALGFHWWRKKPSLLKVRQNKRQQLLRRNRKDTM
jgi:hypothetical protein